VLPFGVINDDDDVITTPYRLLAMCKLKGNESWGGNLVQNSLSGQMPLPTPTMGNIHLTSSFLSISTTRFLTERTVVMPTAVVGVGF